MCTGFKMLKMRKQEWQDVINIFLIYNYYTGLSLTYVI